MRKNIIKIGITGGIGTGKSTVCLIFRQLGTPIYDADQRAKWLMTNNKLLKEEIIEHFGNESYLPNGELNRGYLANQVFQDQQKVALLNALVHPKVGQDMKNWANQQKKNYVLKEAALMIESGSYKELDKIILVDAPLDIRLKRIQKRDPQRTEQEILGIIAKQMPEEEKRKVADFIVLNDQTQLLIPQVLNLHKQFLTLINK
ncbi:MAG: dephospho-CoA kinase [Bacteroidetes bacterium]|nr:MAG: dephospho-CoA kinase [Bacteroidota bacterium]